MSRERSIRLGKIRSQFQKLPLPDKFSRVVTVLLTYVNRETYLCWPSKITLAKNIGCSEKAVARNLKAAKQIGLFDVQTYGHKEMKQLVGSKFNVKASGQRLYALYKLNENHPLWRGEGIEAAKTIIKQYSYAGISLRSGKKSTTSQADKEANTASIKIDSLEI